MTNDTSYRQKGRAVFLAAIMVLSMVAMSAAFAGGAAAQEEYNADAGDLDGAIFFGQEINVTDLSTSETVQLRQGDSDDSSHIENYNTGDNGAITIDTSELDNEQYLIRDNGTDHGPFEVTQQNVEFGFADDSVATGGESSLVFENDNRAETVNVTVDAGGDLDTGELQDAFDWSDGVETTDDDDEVRLVDVTEDDEITTNFTDVAAGDYSFNVEVEDTGASSTANITVNEEAAADASFDSESYSTVVGDTLDFDITTDGEPNDVYFNVTDDDGYYTATVHLENVSDDGHSDGIPVTWNTHNASDAGSTLGFSTDEADDVHIENEEGLAIEDNDNLANEQATFEFESFTDDPTGDVDFRDVAVVDVQQRSTDDLSIHTAPESYSHDGDVEEILNASSEASTIAEEDLLIAQVEASGIYGYMNDTPSAFADNGELNLNLTKQTSGPYTDDASVTIADIGDDNATIETQPDDGQFYVMIDASEIDNLETGDQWNAEFSVGAGNAYVSGDEAETVSANFTYEERNVEFTGEMNDNDRLVVPGTSDATIDGETNVAPGTEVDVRMNFDRDFATASGEVADDGTFAAEANLSDREQGDQFDTRVRAGGDAEVTQASIIGDGTGSTGPSFSVEASADGPVTVGDSASLEYTITNDGDEAGTTNYTVTVGGEEVDTGTTDELGAGNSSDAMTYEDFDTSSAGDLEWEVSTDDNSASGTLTVEEDGSGNETDEGETDDGDSDDGDSDGGQPGFGLIVALFALIGAALLALRRQN